jgi:hypothetical protein
MSHKAVPSVCLVIDASIARAAGSLESTHPTGTRCRQFLQTVRGVCHRMAWNVAIRQEWDKHQSQFARTWLVSMFNLGKLRSVPDDPSEEFRDAIREHAPNDGAREAMLKDAHLAEAAMAGDSRVAALDETVRGHFGRLSPAFPTLCQVVWVNPVLEGQPCIDWLKAGAETEPHRLLQPTPMS